ncbi:hypothetical protein QG37_01878 [Candidozyma auris]|uniref:Uncharacterized protein n=1 Tax=Candidozyma auris TaxID=498019 RepID=A0A0L0P447_CANAR|nr:hypothetical protein QG37_01878 [[Candida] auris]
MYSRLLEREKKKKKKKKGTLLARNTKEQWPPSPKIKMPIQATAVKAKV